jgi:hypothetical protein
LSFIRISEATINAWRTGSVSFEALEEAFGPSSLGIIVVKGLPPDFVAKRRNLLSYASYLANLPQEQLGIRTSILFTINYRH